MICRKLPHLPLYLWSDLLAMDKWFWPYIVCIPAPIDIIIYIATRSQQSAIPGHLHDHLKKMHTPMESEWELEDSIDRRNKGNLPFNNQLSLINCTGVECSLLRAYLSTVILINAVCACAAWLGPVSSVFWGTFLCSWKDFLHIKEIELLLMAKS